MKPTKNFGKVASSLVLLFILLGVTLTYATTENDYTTDDNFLTNISESTHTENGYKAIIILNPNVVGIYANENGYKLDLAINPVGIGGSFEESNYKLDLIPYKTFPEPPIPELRRDVAVTNIVVSKTVIAESYTIFINATIENQGDQAETFDVDMKANATIIQTQSVTLASKNSIIQTFSWNTTGVAKSTYIISAYAWPVQGEMDTADNTYIAYGIKVYVTFPGDLNGDFRCNYKDLNILAINYGKLVPPGDPRADINNDGRVNYKDLNMLAVNYGKVDP